MSNPFDIRPPYPPSLLDPQPQWPAPQPPQPPQAGGNVLWGLLVLGGAVLLLFCGGAAAGMWLVLSGPHFQPEELWHEQLVYVIDTSILPAGEKKQVMTHVKRLAAACDSQVMDYGNLETVLTQLEASPVFVLLDVGWIDQAVVHAQGLSPAEQQAGSRTLIRAVRGVHAGKIASSEFYGALPKGYAYPTRLAIALDDEQLESYYQGIESETAPDASTDDIRAALARLKSLADGAAIPDEPWSYDISDEFGRAVDQALADVIEP